MSIFISYRREGGAEVAESIYNSLYKIITFF